VNYGFESAADDLERRYYGSYYTPEVIARAITEWAVRSARDRVIEPSFGDGVFIDACAERLVGLGATLTTPQVFGTDIDREAVRRVTSANQARALCVALRCADFLAIDPVGDWSSCAAAIGNPPYVRHHLIEKGTIADLRRREAGLSGAADLWCTFVVHAMQFLAPGGRLAFILPGAFGFARYAREVRERLAASFRVTVSIRLAFRAFASAGAEERGVVVLCEGYGEGPSAGWDELVAWDQSDLVSQLATLRDRAEHPTQLTARAAITFPRIAHCALGDLAKISIGFVTGANSTFVIDEATRSKFDLPPETLSPVLSRTAQAPGIRFSKGDHAAAVEQDAKVWLFAPAELGARHGTVRRYLARVTRSTRRNTLWFRKRPRWYRPEIGPRPDAVLTYMNHLGPRIVLLDGAEGATNTFHAVTFNRAVADPSPQLIAIAMLTSFAQLSAEQVGRSYGGGVLKIEPSEARRIAIPVPHEVPENLDLLFEKADALMKCGKIDAACELADEAILRPMLGAGYFEARSQLLAELAAIRSFRLHQTHKNMGA